MPGKAGRRMSNDVANDFKLPVSPKLEIVSELLDAHV